MTLVRSFLLAALAAVCVSAVNAADRVPTDAEVRFFETHIRPVLVEKCHSCHGATRQKSGLRLDTAAGVKNGGLSGEPLFNAKEPDSSLLLKAVRHADGVTAMPPKGKLSDAQIADLAKWAAMGAPFPAPVKRTKDDTHWAFRPVRKPTVPTVTDAPAPANPIDAFVTVKLQSVKLKPGPPADKRTLIRRATFDLIGLPPTPAEIEAFLKDESPNAFEKVVDRLLASKHYGERWGRHWLDVARYADSNGLDENVAHGNAWKYRDYVVDSLNNDVPYDRFVREQVAGDLLPAADDAARLRQLIATGFLSLGPKVLAEPDPKKMEMDIVDEQIDTLGRAVLGMTFGCARCHDHKFDPVTADDYYALAGIFLSTKTMDSFKSIARWYENPLGTPEETAKLRAYDEELARLKARVKELTRKSDAESKVALKEVKQMTAKLEKSPPNVPSAMGVTEGKVADTALLNRGNHLTPGRVVVRRFPTVLVGSKQQPLPTDHSGRLELANWLAEPTNPLTSRVIVNRVWRWHFGFGLVRSVDNFGLLGEPPSHPAMLDWLASDFAANGWSLKKLHRLIMLSNTYRQASEYNTKAAETDPENRLLWRANVCRIEAEEIRDSLLAISGPLDRTMGGPSLEHVKNRDYLFNHTSKDATKYDSLRRSIYLPIIRNNLYEVFQLFDATDAAVGSGDRPTTTVSTQALFWMNSELVSSTADSLAKQMLARTDLDDAGRVKVLYETAYGRLPTTKEVKRAADAVAKFENALVEREPTTEKRKARAWGLYVHVLLAANEFAYVK